VDIGHDDEVPMTELASARRDGSGKV